MEIKSVRYNIDIIDLLSSVSAAVKLTHYEANT